MVDLNWKTTFLTWIFFSFSKNKQVYKLNTSCDSRVHLNEKKWHLTSVLYQELVKGKDKYSNYIFKYFEINNIVYSEKEYAYIWQCSIYLCSNFNALFLLASNKHPILLR